MKVLQKEELSAHRGGFFPVTGGGLTLWVLRKLGGLYDRLRGEDEGGHFGGGGASGSW